MRRQNDAHRAIDSRQFFDDDAVLDIAKAGATELFR